MKGAKTQKGGAGDAVRAPRESTALMRPPLVPQAHGGAIFRGGVVGGRGGPGRPASAVRLAAREAFANRIEVLTGIADGEVIIALREQCPGCGHAPPTPVTVPLKTAAADRVKALDLLARVALPQQREAVIGDVHERVLRTAQVLREALDVETYLRVAGPLAAIWGQGEYGDE